MDATISQVLNTYTAADESTVRAFLRARPATVAALIEAAPQIERIIGRYPLSLEIDPDGPHAYAMVHLPSEGTSKMPLFDAFDEAWGTEHLSDLPVTVMWEYV